MPRKLIIKQNSLDRCQFVAWETNKQLFKNCSLSTPDKLDRKTSSVAEGATSDKSKHKSMNASEKKGDKSKVRRKRKSREEAKEDENLAKRIMIEGVTVTSRETKGNKGDLRNSLPIHPAS